MIEDEKDALSRIEGKTDEIAAAIRDQNEQLRITNARLDEIVALLTPKAPEPGAPQFSDLIAHLIMQGSEQLVLARKTVELLIAMRQDPRDDHVRAADPPLSAAPRS